jgi:hypothetical protein
MVVVGVGAGYGDDPAGTDRRGDGVRIVRGVDEEHLLVVPEQPYVVVDVERLAVEAEGATGDEVLYAGGHVTFSHPVRHAGRADGGMRGH